MLWDCGTFSHIASCVRDFIYIYTYNISHIYSHIVYMSDFCPTVPQSQFYVLCGVYSRPTTVPQSHTFIKV